MFGCINDIGPIDCNFKNKRMANSIYGMERIIFLMFILLQRDFTDEQRMVSMEPWNTFNDDFEPIYRCSPSENAASCFRRWIK